MLKWTVSKRAEPVESISVVLKPSRTTSRRSLGNLHQPQKNRELREGRRKTLGSSEIAKRILNQNKENHIITTPHPMRNVNSNAITSTPFSALRDVSNITPNNNNNSPAAARSATPSRKRNLPLSPVTNATAAAVIVPPGTVTHQTYASTLPTFDVEYSPCGGGIKSGPLIALRGLTVQNSIFGNPFYFREDMPPASKRLKFSPEMTPLARRLSELRFSKMSMKRPDTCRINDIEVDPDDSIISSKALNDSELEKMIDAILESSRKTKLNSGKKSAIANVTAAAKTSLDSETICTSAATKPHIIDDCTNNISELCDNFKISPTKLGERTIILEETNLINEREVKTPVSASECDGQNFDTESCHLRRQKGVRRKHNRNDRHSKTASKKIEQSITSTNSPETPLYLKRPHLSPKSIDILACMNTPKNYGRINENNNSLKDRETMISNNTSKASYESTPAGIETNDVQGSSTPTGAQQTIRRCLFSESPDSMEDSLDRRKSVASSTTSRCSKSSNIISGSLDVAITADDNKIQIHGELLMV